MELVIIRQLTKIQESHFVETNLSQRRKLHPKGMMVAKDYLHRAYNDDGDSLDEIIRLSPTPGTTDPYRCPVSTPANARRNANQRNAVQFTSISRHSLRIPNNVTCVRQFHGNRATPSKHRGAKAPRKKNFDYYYVDKHVQNSMDCHLNSSWLKSLCSQPVDEIFTKYKRHADSTRLKQAWGKTVSTPGEMAISAAWSTTTSQRGSSASCASRATSRSVLSASPEMKFATQYYPGMDDDWRTPSFALMPVPSPTLDDNRKRVQSRVIAKTGMFPAEAKVAFVDQTYYDQFKSDKRFPTIKPRKRTVVSGKQKVYLNNLPTRHDKNGESLSTDETVHVQSLDQTYTQQQILARPSSYTMAKENQFPVLKGKG